MIEFLGYLTDDAEKYYWKRSRRIGRNIMWCAMLFLSPAIIAFSVNSRQWAILIGWGVVFASIPLLCLIPKSKKEKKHFRLTKYLQRMDISSPLARNLKNAGMLKMLKL